MKKYILLFIIIFLILFTSYYFFYHKKMLTLEDYKSQKIISRKSIMNHCTCDSEIHTRAFGGESLDFITTINFMKRTGILMCSMKGIGQRLPENSDCNYYLDCPNTPLRPSIINDIINASNYYKYYDEFKNDIIVIMSMSFLDLHTPDKIPMYIEIFDYEFPGLFKCVGEVNLCKPAIQHNDRSCVPKNTIKDWYIFMNILQKRNLPMFVHCDMGNNKENTKYLYLFKEMCDLYPNNKIVWCHMGLSKELINIPVDKHINILKSLLDKYPNLYINISWRIIYDNYFIHEDKMMKYVNFFNVYYNRILPASDFVGSVNKTYSIYAEESYITSYVLQFVDNRAFRHIALGQNFIDLFKINSIQAPEIID